MVQTSGFDGFNTFLEPNDLAVLEWVFFLTTTDAPSCCIYACNYKAICVFHGYWTGLKTRYSLNRRMIYAVDWAVFHTCFNYNRVGSTRNFNTMSRRIRLRHRRWKMKNRYISITDGVCFARYIARMSEYLPMGRMAARQRPTTDDQRWRWYGKMARRDGTSPHNA